MRGPAHRVSPQNPTRDADLSAAAAAAAPLAVAMSSATEPTNSRALQSIAAERPQLRHRVSIHELTAPVEDAASPRPFDHHHPQQQQQLQTQKHSDSDLKMDDVASRPANPPSHAESSEVAELRSEIESLEEVIERLAEEKQALRMRLNEVEYARNFQVGHCKRWLQANFDFDRKDSPDLLAGIFEDYLLQNDSFEPLPHQMIVKNSTKGRLRREKLVQQRSQLRGLKREAKPGAVALQRTRMHVHAMSGCSVLTRVRRL